MTLPRFIGLACALLLGIAAPAQPADPAPTTRRMLMRDVSEAFEARAYARARDLLEAALRENPKDPFTTYNLACALAMLGEADAAGETLIDAVGFGFSDLSHARRDPHLEPIRAGRQYQAIMRGWRTLLDARGDADERGAREALGPQYTYERDPDLRFTYASAFREESFDDARKEIDRVARWTHETLGIVPTLQGDEPDPWIVVVLPTPADFLQLVGVEGVGGYFDKDRKRLIAQDVGPTLRHESFHIFHWRDMDRVGQSHPYWIMEGLACLLEDVEHEGDGYRLMPSWRTNIAKRLERANRLTPWKRLFAMERPNFMGPQARAHYAQARAVLMFLHDRGLLTRWYRTYVAGYDADPTGLDAIAAVLDASPEDADKQYRQWLRELPVAGEVGKPGSASLGVALTQGAGEGPIVDEIVSLSRVKHTGDQRLKRLDVITHFEGTPTRNLDDFHRVLAAHDPGDEVTLRVLRGARAVEVRIILVPYSDLQP